MQHDSRQPTVMVQHSSAIDVTMLAVAAALGWLFATASQNARRETPVGAARKPRPAPPPRPAAPVAFATSHAAGQLPGKWKNGARWASSENVMMGAAISDAVTGATAQDIRDLQMQTQQAAQDAHAAAFIQFNQTQDIRYSRQADAINQKDDEFNAALKQKVISLVGGDISQLNAKSGELKQTALEIPNAANAIGKIDSFLGVFDQLIGLL